MKTITAAVAFFLVASPLSAAIITFNDFDSATQGWVDLDPSGSTSGSITDAGTGVTLTLTLSAGAGLVNLSAGSIVGIDGAGSSGESNRLDSGLVGDTTDDEVLTLTLATSGTPLSDLSLEGIDLTTFAGAGENFDASDGSSVVNLTQGNRTINYGDLGALTPLSSGNVATWSLSITPRDDTSGAPGLTALSLTNVSFSFSAASVPEPSSTVFLLCLLGGALWVKQAKARRLLRKF